MLFLSLKPYNGFLFHLEYNLGSLRSYGVFYPSHSCTYVLCWDCFPPTSSLSYFRSQLKCHLLRGAFPEPQSPLRQSHDGVYFFIRADIATGENSLQLVGWWIRACLSTPLWASREREPGCFFRGRIPGVRRSSLQHMLVEQIIK